MNEKIKRLFEKAIVPAHITPPHPEVLWLIDDSASLLGFWRDQLNEKETALLTYFYKEYQHTPKAVTYTDKEWRAWLLESDVRQPNIERPVRLIHFHLSESIDDYEALSSTWQEAFPHVITIVWVHQQYGVVVLESIDGYGDEMDIESFAEAISMDFYLDLYTLIGIESTVENSRESFLFQHELFQYLLSKSHPKHVYKEQEVLLLYLMRNSTGKEMDRIIQRLISVELLNDKELLTTVGTYFSHNLNTTQAAKALHMHRNSLQYRIDKFVDRTGIDIKQFSDAALVYMLLLHYQHD
ncbi:helix-turn-helix domain-containing protein [Alkalihalophilus pseudofirmus]|uniref:PucR family transcriptional regulator n=1 Tax=Alkalihalophilus pseudofirmus TaxID=79885 RepID=UPI00259BE9E6|nr:helix-turn-helix domain-containing protein [Alkalihalophilus pseudofirmus]WEG17608.1 helix-turn-helix domain-containing protein [Alkalihalophilus pseudofirmus]